MCRKENSIVTEGRLTISWGVGLGGGMGINSNERELFPGGDGDVLHLDIVMAAQVCPSTKNH